MIHHYCKALSSGHTSSLHTCILSFTNQNTQDSSFKRKIENGPSLQEFIRNSGEVDVVAEIQKEELIPYLSQDDLDGQNRKGG